MLGFYRLYSDKKCFYLLCSEEKPEIPYLNTVQPSDQIIGIAKILNATIHYTEFPEFAFSKTEGNEEFESDEYIEIGPRIGTISACGTTIKTILHRIGFTSVIRIEQSTLYSKQQQVQYDPMTMEIYPKNGLNFKQFFGSTNLNQTFTIKNNREAIFSLENRLGFDVEDINNYISQLVFDKKAGKRTHDYTDVELLDLAQSNSEHSRHWLFNGKIIRTNKDDQVESLPETLFQLVKKTVITNPNNSLVAMKDNSSAIKGYYVNMLTTNYNTINQNQNQNNYNNKMDISFNSPMTIKQKLVHPILTAETHNFPTGIAPFPGAATGAGGRIRDVQAMGRGGLMLAGIAGYSVGNIDLKQTRSSNYWKYPIHRPETILIEASNGASDYGNKIGEPLILGYTRSFGERLRCENGYLKRIEWVKPIMFSAGIGQIYDEHVYKEKSEVGWLIVRLGGPAYRIGVGGGAASSKSQGEKGESAVDLNAVQRDDPEMENRLNKVIRTLIELELANPIRSIHDQGAGGMGNVTKEIIADGGVNGGLVSLGNVISGDPTLSARELWIAEYQEQNTILIHPKDTQIVKTICLRENLPVSFVGVVTESGRIQVYNPSAVILPNDDVNTKIAKLFPVDLNLKEVVSNVPQKRYHIAMSQFEDRKFLIQPDDSSFKLTLDCIELEKTGKEGVFVDRLNYLLRRVLANVTVGSKRFLTNKVDRSVTGLVAQQQCVGPLGTPLADYSLMAQSYFGTTGIASSIGEQPIKGFADPSKMVRMTVGEMLTNLIWVKCSGLGDVKCSGNWMWEKQDPLELDALVTAVKSLSDIMIELGIAIDGGKDSLSMSANADDEMVISPRTLVITSYVTVPNINKKVTPDLKAPGNHLFYIDLGYAKYRLGGSVLLQSEVGPITNNIPDFEHRDRFVRLFKVVQDLIDGGLIESGHDRSDGGLITTILEMAFAGNYGVSIDLEILSDYSEVDDLVRILFAEELGLVMEIKPENINKVIERLRPFEAVAFCIGKVLVEKTIKFCWNERVIYGEDMTVLRDIWESVSFELEARQCEPKCVKRERRSLKIRNGPKYHLKKGSGLVPSPSLSEVRNRFKQNPLVAILREEGSNGDREMAAAFHSVGFTVIDLTMSDLVSGRMSLDRFNGLALVGGFSFSDVLGAAQGWSLTIKEDPSTFAQFERFYKRKTTFSLGVCNGCQLMSKMKWVNGTFSQNYSGRFESRWVTVKIPNNTKAMMLKNLRGSVLGVHVAHGEGRFVPDGSFDMFEEALWYVNDEGLATTEYPDNPNGSEYGLAGLCNEDGRHLAMMPHPERCFKKWQTQWIGPEFNKKLIKEGYVEDYPWIRMFQTAYKWSVKRMED